MTKKKQRKKNEQKPKLQTKAVIDKDLVRVLSLTMGKMVRYTISAIYFNAKEKELVATDGSNLLVVKIKSTGLLSTALDLEEGLYDIKGDMLIRNDMNQKEINFPNYQGVIPVKPKKICSGDILHGLLDCIAKNQIHLDIWKFAPVLKTLGKISEFWNFANNSPTEPVVIKSENSNYIIKYVMMGWPGFFTNMI